MSAHDQFSHYTQHDQQQVPTMALQALTDSVKALRRIPSVSLDTKLSDVRSTVNALVPLVSMPIWLPFTFMFSVFSYFFAILVQALDASDSSSLQWEQKLDTLKLQRTSSTTSLTGIGSSGSPSILRAVDQVLEIITSLPSSSTKYSFTRNLAEQLLKDNTAQKPPMVDLSRVALTKAFRRTVDQLEACLTKDSGVSGAWMSIMRRCSQAAGWASGIAASADLAQASPGASLRAEKLSQELCWLADLLFQYGGGLEAMRIWVNSPVLAEAARYASPRVQSSLVKLAALLVRACAGLEWTVAAEFILDSTDGTTACIGAQSSDLAYRQGVPPMPFMNSASWAPPDLQYRLLLLWLPLMCRAFHSGDGPILSTSEKQRTEEGLRRIILNLSHSEQEVLFSNWLYEYSWSSSDWPNLQPQYVAWCERARKVATVSEVLDRS